MNIATECMVLTLTNNKIMNTEDIKDFIRNRALRYAGSCSSQGSMEFNILNELYFDLFGEPAVNTIPKCQPSTNEFEDLS